MKGSFKPLSFSSSYIPTTLQVPLEHRSVTFIFRIQCGIWQSVGSYECLLTETPEEKHSVIL